MNDERKVILCLSAAAHGGTNSDCQELQPMLLWKYDSLLGLVTRK